MEVQEIFNHKIQFLTTSIDRAIEVNTSFHLMKEQRNNVDGRNRTLAGILHWSLNPARLTAPAHPHNSILFIFDYKKLCF